MINKDLDQVKGVIFDIQRYSIHDGPGIRTVVFLKGCPLNCIWCQNPEGINPKPEIGFNITKCKHCGRCIQICPSQNIDFKNDGRINRQSCNVCGKCVDECYAEALNIFGKEMTTDEVLSEVQKDSPFYQENGGVTFSGGEPTYQIAFLYKLLKKCKKEGIKTALETCGFFKWAAFEPLLKYVDTILFDLKIIDNRKHLEYCGCSNELILQNAINITTILKEIRFRIPLIPGINDNKKNIIQTCNLLKKLNHNTLYLIPYHKLGHEKYLLLNRTPRDEQIKSITIKKIKKVQKWIKDEGLNSILIV